MKQIKKIATFVFGLVASCAYSQTAMAGVIELSFPWGKESSCSVTAKYWDGAQEAYSCSATFSSAQQPGSWGKGMCSGKQSIDNLKHRNSRLDISTKGRCMKTYMTNLLGEFRVKEDYSGTVSRQGSWFVNETAVDARKFNNSVAAVGRSKMGWGAVDLRRFKHNNRLMIFLNKEAQICVRQKSGLCRDQEEAHYTQIESE